MNEAMNTRRVDWVDYAKGICIVLVVMMHSVHNYQDLVGQTGWLGHVVDFARPFRMPDFFLIAGLFLSRSIHGPLVEYFDRKVLHFVYFYVLWLTIQMGVVEAELLIGSPLEFAGRFLRALVEPTNTLWFVHMLAVFYVATRLVRRFPKLLVFAAAVGLQTAYQYGLIDTGWSVIDRFANRYVYFFAGYAAAPYIFAFAERVIRHPRAALSLLATWGVGNWMMVGSELHNQPGSSLVMAFLGAAAVVSMGALLAQRDWAAPIRYAGANSIVVYLTFFFPMVVLMKLFAQTGIVSDVGWASLLINLGAVAAPLAFHRLIRDTPLNLLYVRPEQVRLRARLNAARAGI